MLRVSTPTSVDLPLSTLPMMATRTSMGDTPSPARRRTNTSAVWEATTPPAAATEQAHRSCAQLETACQALVSHCELCRALVSHVDYGRLAHPANCTSK
jgi:hypothetical protein